MINTLLNLLGLKNEIDHEFKKMLDFPKTLFFIDSIALVFLVLNSLIKFIQFNNLLSTSLYSLVITILLISIFLKFKVNKDFAKIRYDINQNINKSYYEFYNNIKKSSLIDDVFIDIEECKLSRNLDIKCVQQEISEEFINKFINDILDNKKEEIDYSIYPAENWDIYQIYGLKKGYIVNNKCTLYMKDKLPIPNLEENLSENDCNIISMYLNAISTLKKENQIIYKKQEQPERKIIDVCCETENDFKNVERTIIDTESLDEKEIRNILETDKRFKDKNLSDVIKILNKINNDKNR